MRVDSDKLEELKAVLEENKEGIFNEVNHLISIHKMSAQGGFVDDWYGIEVNGHVFDANFYREDKDLSCCVYPVVDLNIVTEVSIKCPLFEVAVV